MFSDNKSKIILILVIILAFGIIFLGYSISLGNGSGSDAVSSNDSITINQSLPSEPIPDAKIDTRGVKTVLLGQNRLGSVEVLGPFGNPNSDVKIAYSIGMHPWESKVHKALFDTVKAKSSSLNYCYYIYNINVTNYNTEDEGRMDGQLLAQEFVAPHIIDNGYDLFLDIHSNKGTVAGTYEQTNFVFAVGQDEKSEIFVNKILDKMDELVYYFPQDQSSPPYITLPVEQSGIPTVNYETFSYENINTTYSLIDKLVETVDNLDFN